MLAVGTRGDVQPYVALGRGLQLAGHDVLLGTSANLVGFVHAHGLDAVAIAGDSTRWLRWLRAPRPTAADRLVLYGFSPALVPRPDDWPPSVRITGAWSLAAGAGWRPPARLAAFLAAGPPPVYIGFGSLAAARPELLATAVDAVPAAGPRGAPGHPGG